MVRYRIIFILLLLIGYGAWGQTSNKKLFFCVDLPYPIMVFHFPVDSVINHASGNLSNFKILSKNDSLFLREEGYVALPPRKTYYVDINNRKLDTVVPFNFTSKTQGLIVIDHMYDIRNFYHIPVQDSIIKYIDYRYGSVGRGVTVSSCLTLIGKDSTVIKHVLMPYYETGQILQVFVCHEYLAVISSNLFDHRHSYGDAWFYVFKLQDFLTPCENYAKKSYDLLDKDPVFY